MLDLYNKKITNISLDSLKALADLTSFPICVCGGWAVYFTINELFKEQKNRDYIGSQDIDIGFYLAPMMTKTELESTILFKMLNILKSNGFKPEGFRYKKEIKYSQLDIKDEKQKSKDFVLYVDVLVNSYPPSLYNIYPNCFFEVPLIEQVYSNNKYQVKISSISNKLFVPTREIITAMKIQSLPSRGNSNHKKIKDLCDLYSLLWFSKKSVHENIDDVLNFVDVNSIKRLKDSINKDIILASEGYLEEPKGSLNTVLNDLYKYVFG